MEDEERKGNRIVYYPACCWGRGSFGAYLCGFLLVLVGGLWLLHSLDLIPPGWNGLIGPPLLIVFGIACLIGTGRQSQA